MSVKRLSATATTVTVLTAVSAAAAAATDTFRGALFRAYGLTATVIFDGARQDPTMLTGCCRIGN